MTTNEINELLGKIAEPETPEERDAAWNEIADRLKLMDAMHKELNALCGWGDESFVHAYAHIGNVIKNLRADARTEKILRERAEAIIDLIGAYQLHLGPSGGRKRKEAKRGK